LIFLELGGKISCNLSVFLKSKILRTVLAGETVYESFILNTKIILKLVEICGKIMICAKVSDQDWVIALNWSSLLLKAEVGVKIIDNPSAINWNVFSG